MATAISYNEIQALYLGLLDRPADAKGEAYWYGNGTASSSSVAQNIGSFAQYYSADNGLNGVAISSSNITGEITNIYTNMLGYTPSSSNTGVAYWAGVFNTDVTQGMTAGAAIGSIADQIYNIVENLQSTSPYINEKTTMNDKISAATTYTTTEASVPYSSAAYAKEGTYINTNITQAATVPSAQVIDMSASKTNYVANSPANGETGSVTFVVNDLSNHNGTSASSNSPSVFKRGRFVECKRERGNA